MNNECALTAYCVNTARCHECCGQFSVDEALSIELPLLYTRSDTNGPKLHPIQEERKRLKKERHLAERLRKTAPTRRRNLAKLRESQANERRTRNAVVRATAGSGALHSDGDSRLGDGTIGIDDKLQSRAHKQFTVRVDEVDKARLQNCFIVITTAEGRKFAVAELDYLLSNASTLGELFNGN